MKKQQIETLSKRYLLNDLEYFKAKGELIYKVANDNILQGIHFEGSAFDKNQLAVNIFVQSLYIPSGTIDLSNGFRIRNKENKEWWTITNDNAPTLFKEILEQIKTKALPFLEKINTPEEFYNFYKLQKDKSIREQDAVTLSAITCNHKDYKSEINKLKKISEKKEYKELSWAKEILQNILKVENADEEKRKEIFKEWKNYTINNLKLVL